MTGAGCIMVGDGPYGGGGGGPPPTLHISLSNSAGSTVNVSGASGSSTIFNYTVSGGSGFYTVDTGADNMNYNPSGKLGEGPPSTPPNNSATTGTFAVTWTGFAVNETQAGGFAVSVTDSLGASASSSAITVNVKRTS